MRAERIDIDARHIRKAVSELQVLMRQYYPEASFQVTQGEDPAGTYMITTVDVDDTDAVVDVYIDRLLELQIGDGLCQCMWFRYAHLIVLQSRVSWSNQNGHKIKQPPPIGWTKLVEFRNAGFGFESQEV